MSIYHVSGGISSFGCEFGNIEIDADGFAEIPNGMIIEALIRHGFQVTPKGDDSPAALPAAAPVAVNAEATEEPPALPLNGGRKSGGKKQQAESASEEDALDRAIGAVTGE